MIGFGNVNGWVYFQSDSDGKYVAVNYNAGKQLEFDTKKELYDWVESELNK